MIKNRPSIRAPKKARGAKRMADSDKIPQIDPTEIEILIEKLEQNKLEERERRLIVALLRTFLYIVAQLQEKKITLLKIKDMIFGRKSEKNKKEKKTEKTETRHRRAVREPASLESNAASRGMKKMKRPAPSRKPFAATDEILFRLIPERRK
jgi:hypothetical protein